MLQRLNNKTFLFFTFAILILSVFSHASLQKKSAERVKDIFTSIIHNKVKAKRIVLTEEEINSYLYFYRSKIFIDDVKWVKVKISNNLIKARIVMFLKANFNNSFLALFKGSMLDINSRFKIENLNQKGCFKFDLVSININNFNLEREFALSLISAVSPEFDRYFKGFCPKYNIKRILLRDKKLVLFF